MELDIKSCSWSSLPAELLDQIFIRLEDILDVLCCTKVCVSWRIVATEVYKRSLVPLLLIFSGGGDISASLFNISTRKYSQEINLQETHGQLICNSTNGWLLTITDSSPYDINLLNPITKAQVSFPSLSTLESARLSERDYSLKKGITSSRPVEKDCFVLIIYGLLRKLACCKKGDRKWIALDDFGFSFADIMYHEGRFYAIDSNEKIVSWELGLKSVCCNIKVLSEPAFCKGAVRQKYLVESVSGEILLVYRRWDYHDDDFGTKILFEIYKLDLIAKEWRKVDYLGDQPLFIGRDGLKSVATGNCAALLRGNYIYWIGYSSQTLSDDSAGIGKQSVSTYDLQSNNIIDRYESKYSTSQLNWIVPDV